MGLGFQGNLCRSSLSLLCRMLCACQRCLTRVEFGVGTYLVVRPILELSSTFPYDYP